MQDFWHSAALYYYYIAHVSLTLWVWIWLESNGERRPYKDVLLLWFRNPPAPRYANEKLKLIQQGFVTVPSAHRHCESAGVAGRTTFITCTYGIAQRQHTTHNVYSNKSFKGKWNSKPTLFDRSPMNILSNFPTIWICKLSAKYSFNLHW